MNFILSSSGVQDSLNFPAASRTRLCVQLWSTSLEEGDPKMKQVSKRIL